MSSYFLIPHNYFNLPLDTNEVDLATTTVSGQQGFTATVDSNINSFETYKAFSTDNGEYYRYNGTTSLAFDRVFIDSPQAVMYYGDEILVSAATEIRLFTDDEYPVSPVDMTLKVPQAVYGDGTINGTGLFFATEFDALSLSLVTYTEETAFTYFALHCPYEKARPRFYNITAGILVELPNYKQKATKSIARKYVSSGYDNSVVGRPLWKGMLDNNLRRNFTLQFEFLTPDQRNTVLRIFKRGNGALPMWYIPDLTDNTTWVYCSLPSMSVSEPYAEYFNVDLKVEEY